tara:strand:- start:720 stop:2396 length:1677 start_codon:yes stop_codon:yes gene_type:complete
MSMTFNAQGETFSFEDGTNPAEAAKAIQRHFATQAAQQTAQNPPAPTASQAAPVVEEIKEEKGVGEQLMDSVAGVPKLMFNTARAVTDGLTMGSLDEMASGVNTGISLLTGSNEGYSAQEIYDANMAEQKSSREKFADEYAILSAGAEITGAILSPVTKALGAIKVVKSASAAAPVVNAATQGVVGSVPYVFLSTDGSVVERMDEAASVAVPAAIFGVAGSKMVSVGGSVKNFSKDVFNRVFLKVSQSPLTTETLKASKNAAYKLVKDNDIRFSGSSLNTAKNSLVNKLQQGKDWSPNNALMNDALGVIDNMAKAGQKKGAELINLDQAQQALWKKYTTAKRQGDGPAQSVILDTINSIDDLIAKHPSTHEVMSAARLANRRFKKAETFDRIANKIANNEAFKGASAIDQTKAALVKMMDDPRAMRNFDDIEVTRFKEFLSDGGTLSEKALKKIGTLSPTSRLGFVVNSVLAGAGGYTTGGASLVPQAGMALATQGAKKFAEGMQNARTRAFQSEMKGNPRVPNRAVVNGAVSSAPTSMFAEAMKEDSLEREKRLAAR